MDYARHNVFRNNINTATNNKLCYFATYKPFDMLCQFTKEGNHTTLADLYFNFPKDVYPLGRLDTDSEGLLILSNDKRLNHLLLDPIHKHQRIYYAQVEGTPTPEKLNELAKGLTININGQNYRTQPCVAEIIDTPLLPERNPPIRYRKNVPTAWIKLKLTEGKNRQVRKMTAKIGYPTLRLVRVAIEGVTINQLNNGEVVEFDKKTIYSLLKIKNN